MKSSSVISSSGRGGVTKSSAASARATARIRQRATSNTPSSLAASTPVSQSSELTGVLSDDSKTFTKDVPSFEKAKPPRDTRVAWIDSLDDKKQGGQQQVPQRLSQQVVTGGLRSTLRSTMMPHHLKSSEAEINEKIRYLSKDVSSSLTEQNKFQHTRVENSQRRLPLETLRIESDESEEVLSEEEVEFFVETVEDLEQVQQHDYMSVDATCISDQSTIMIKSHNTGKAVRKRRLGSTNGTFEYPVSYQKEAEDFRKARDSVECSGFALGDWDELFSISILSRNNRSFESSTKLLRYGDNIILIMSLNQKQSGTIVSDKQQLVLGVEKARISAFREGEPSNHEEDQVVLSDKEKNLGHLNRAYQWTVLRYSSTVPVRIGSTAVQQSVRYEGLTPPIHFGDRIILRNVQTGGILCCRSNSSENGMTGSSFKLRILNDSYDLQRTHNLPTTNGNPSLLSQLQQSNLLMPSYEEVFYFSSASSPPQPRWLTSNQTDSRPYLDGSYLFRRPNGANDRFASERVPSLLSDQHQTLLKMARQKKIDTISGQEQILVDEVIGSLIGAEGEFIKASLISGADHPLLPIKFELLNDSSTSRPRFDTIICNLVNEILALSTSFVRVRHFVYRHCPGYEYGSVMQALAQSLDDFLMEYLNNTIVAIERERVVYTRQQKEMTLRNLLTQIRKALDGMDVVERACVATFKEKGGSLINALTRLKLHNYRGNKTGEGILERLLEAASVPYMTMLTRWLEAGELYDPYKEFMIAVNESSKAQEDTLLLTSSWEDRYHLIQENILEGFFATRLTVEQVLATGRYWNALRACSTYGSLALPPPSLIQVNEVSHQLHNSTNVATASSYVLKLYKSASQELLRVMMVDYDLLGSLRLMKRYFLLEHGDFFVNFLDVAENELQKDLSQISRGRVQHWLNVSVQQTEQSSETADKIIQGKTTTFSTTATDSSNLPNHTSTLSKLRCRFATTSLLEYLDQLHASTGGIQTIEPWTPLRHTYSTGTLAAITDGKGLSGLEAFLIEFSLVPFPVSLVLSQRAISEYQLLFRHLFYAKHVERRLVSIWQDHQFMKELQSLRGTMGPTFLLRQRMLHFVQSLLYYMMFEVIEPNWINMEESIQTVNHAANVKTEQTVDDILKVHNQFLERALEACLLTNRELVRALTKLLRTCLLFTEQMKRFLKATKIEDDRNIVAGEMQKVVQKNLNERRRSIDTENADEKLLRATMHRARKEREQRVQRQTIRVQREVSSKSYQRMVLRFEQVFSDNLREFMLLLNHSDDSYHTHKVNLCIRLDYNGYVSGTCD